MRRSSTSRARSYTVSSDQDHRRDKSLGKPILINPLPLVGPWRSWFSLVLALFTMRSCRRAISLARCSASLGRNKVERLVDEIKVWFG
jgi:hypothetical protein